MTANIKTELAILGGEPEINYKFSKYNTIGEEESLAVNGVMKSGNIIQLHRSSRNRFSRWIECKKV